MANTDRIKGISSGLAVKAPVRAATTAAITLSGLQTIDGIVLASGDRVLVKDQADAIDNGWYDVSTSAWSRSVDANGNNDLVTGTLCVVAAGTENSDSMFRLDSTGVITPGTTALTFTASVSFTDIPTFAPLTGEALNFARVSAGETGLEYRTPAEVLSDIGAQAADADTAKLDVDQTWTGAQRGTLTTDNDGSFDQNVTNNFACTPTGAVALTFTNHTAGQTGLILFVNGSNYAITAAATTYIAAADLTKLSATGSYTIAYISNGTNTYCTVSAALTSAGA
jgi:hypothetical protein